MALVVADRVQETTTTTGTGTYTLAGAKDGFQSFAVVGNSNTTYYACTDGTDYEVGIGTYTLSGTTLARTTIIESSNSDAAVNWGAGEKDIFVTLPASKATVLDASGNATFTGDVTFDGDAADIIFDKSHDALAFRQGAALKFASTSSTAQQSRIQWDGTRTHWETFNSTRVDLDGDFRFVGASYNVEWDKSEDALHFNDRATLSFGGTSATPDMWIEHNNLLNLNRIRGSNITIQDYDGSNIAVFQEDAGAALYFNGGLRAEVVTGGFDVTGNITVSGTVDGRDVATDGTKLDGIEAGANVGPSLAVAIALG